MTRLTFDPGEDRFPVRTPDGTRVVFSSTESDVGDVYWTAVDGTETAELLLL